METEQVIIYRSKWEAERDQFFFDNPEYIVYFFLGIVGVLSLVFLVEWIRNKFGIRRKFRR